jgi:Xaa-Pro dipeptidase
MQETEMISRTEAQLRISRIQTLLKEKGIDGALFIFPIDVYYFSGTRQTSTLWLPVEGEPLLLVRKSLVRAREESPLADIRPFPASKDFPALFADRVKKIGFTFDVAPVLQLNFYSKLLPGLEFVDISALNRELRSVKSPWELEQMQASGDRLCEVFAQIPQFLRPGMREIDLAAEFECRLRKAGSEGYVRMRAFNQELIQGVAVSGRYAAQPGYFDGPVTGRGLSAASPQGASTEVIERNVPIVMDFAGTFNGYLVDMTRMFVIGSLGPELLHAFATALDIQTYLAENLKPGNICEELYAGALERADRAGLGKNFMGAPGENAKFVGHGVGLELDEFPAIAQGFKAPLQAGQVLALEPKFVFPGLGAIGIENDFVVANNGGVRITKLSDAIVFL